MTKILGRGITVCQVRLAQAATMEDSILFYSIKLTNLPNRINACYVYFSFWWLNVLGVYLTSFIWVIPIHFRPTCWLQ